MQPYNVTNAQLNLLPVVWLICPCCYFQMHAEDKKHSLILPAKETEFEAAFDGASSQTGLNCCQSDQHLPESLLWHHQQPLQPCC